MSQTVTAVEMNFDQSERKQATTNELGMRPMQARAYEKRNASHLLIKAPPASGKSRCLMFLALDKLYRQGVKKAIVAVPEVSIGASFADTDLKTHGFFANWSIESKWDLCSPGADEGAAAKSKVKALLAFLESDDLTLICTHATLRFAYQEAGIDVFRNCLIAIDEFHHASSDDENRLGAFVRDALQYDDIQLVAMTGSYFRGDELAILTPEEEGKFTSVSYTYWEQMSNYEHLKTLRIDYSFYSALDGSYLQAIPRVLDTSKKTIIHIPRPGSAESVGSKYGEVFTIIDHIGEKLPDEPDTNFWPVKTPDGRTLIVANLVEDDKEFRSKVQAALRDPKQQERVDIIIALGMAKEGFDWPPAEHAITIGYRGSLTEVIQIIGRVTRDHPGKHTAVFTNLIPEPKADDSEVTYAVNQMLKAISVSLAMEQALAPKFKFVPKNPNKPNEGMGETDPDTGEIRIGIKGLTEPVSQSAKDAIEHDMNELIAEICQDKQVLRAMANEDVPAEIIQDVHISRIIEARYPNESEHDQEAIRQQVAAHMAMAAVGNGEMSGDQELGGFDEEKGNDDPGSRKFVSLIRKFINVNELNVDLVDRIDPFGHAYSVLSKGLTSDVLKAVHGTVKSATINMTDEEAVALFPRIEQFTKDNGREPSFESINALEKRLGEALEHLRKRRRERLAEQAAE